MQARVAAHRPLTSAGRGWPPSKTSCATEKDDLMAVPKRRTSKRKKRARRTHYKAAPIALQPCPRCGDLKRPHRVCPTCGYYRDEQRVAVEDTLAGSASHSVRGVGTGPRAARVRARPRRCGTP